MQMKKLSAFVLFLMLCGMRAFACADELSAGVAKAFEDPKWDGYRIAVISDYYGNESFAEQCALVMKNGDHNVLCIVEKELGVPEYRLTVETDKAIYQGDLLPLLLIDTDRDFLFYTYPHEGSDLEAESFVSAKLDDTWFIPTLRLFYAEDENGFFPLTQVWFDGSTLHYDYMLRDENGNVVQRGEAQSISHVPLSKFLHHFTITSMHHGPAAARVYFAIPENQAIILDLGGYLNTVKLRSQPSTDGRTLGQYFSGVPVEVIENQGKWSRIAVGEREGYIATGYLSFNADLHISGVSGFIEYPEADGRLPLYQSADTESTVLTRMRSGYVQVLGMVDGGWLHILYSDYENGYSRMIGYASSDAIANTDNFATVVVDTGDPAIKAILRAAPSHEAEVVAQIFSGTKMHRMFDDHTNGDDWLRARVGNALGYMLTDDLDFSSGSDHRFFPPQSRALLAPLPVYDTATGTQASGSLEANAAFSVLGVQGDRYLLRIETSEPNVYIYQYADMSAIQPVEASASTGGI